MPQDRSLQLNQTIETAILQLQQSPTPEQLAHTLTVVRRCMPVSYTHLDVYKRQVWALLLQIPYGQTVTYGELARQLAEKQGRPRMSAQAVGGAVGHNKISIIIPCHRVVGTGGSLTGYAGGIDRKVKLLALEQADMTRFFVPKTGTALL